MSQNFGFKFLVLFNFIKHIQAKDTTVSGNCCVTLHKLFLCLSKCSTYHSLCRRRNIRHVVALWRQHFHLFLTSGSHLIRSRERACGGCWRTESCAQTEVGRRF